MGPERRDNYCGELRLLGVERLFGFICLHSGRDTMFEGRQTANLLGNIQRHGQHQVEPGLRRGDGVGLSKEPDLSAFARRV